MASGEFVSQLNAAQRLGAPDLEPKPDGLKPDQIFIGESGKTSTVPTPESTLPINSLSVQELKNKLTASTKGTEHLDLSAAEQEIKELQQLLKDAQEAEVARGALAVETLDIQAPAQKTPEGKKVKKQVKKETEAPLTPEQRFQQDKQEIEKICPNFFKYKMPIPPENATREAVFNFFKNNSPLYTDDQFGLRQRRILYGEKLLDDQRFRTDFRRVFSAQVKFMEQIEYLEYIADGAFSRAVHCWYREEDSGELKHTVIKYEKDISNTQNKVSAASELKLARDVFGKYVAQTEIILEQGGAENHDIRLFTTKQEFMQQDISEYDPTEARRELGDFYQATLKAHCLGYFFDLSQGQNYLQSAPYRLSQDGTVKIFDFNALVTHTPEEMKELEQYFQNGQLPIEFDTSGKPLRLRSDFKAKLKEMKTRELPEYMIGGAQKIIELGSDKYDFRDPDMLEAFICGGDAIKNIPIKYQVGLKRAHDVLDQFRQFCHGTKIPEDQILSFLGSEKENQIALEKQLASEDELRKEIEDHIPTREDLGTLTDFFEQEAKKAHDADSLRAFRKDFGQFIDVISNVDPQSQTAAAIKNLPELVEGMEIDSSTLNSIAKIVRTYSEEDFSNTDLANWEPGNKGLMKMSLVKGFKAYPELWNKFKQFKSA